MEAVDEGERLVECFCADLRRVRLCGIMGILYLRSAYGANEFSFEVEQAGLRGSNGCCQWSRHIINLNRLYSGGGHKAICIH